MGDISLIFLWLIGGIYFVTVLCVVVIIIAENRNPVRSLAWVTVLTVVPVVGLLLYFIFGRDISTKRVVPRKVKRKLRKLEIKQRLGDDHRERMDENSRKLVRMGELLSISVLHNYCDAKLFVDGGSKYSALLEDLRNARKSILMEYYIIEQNGIGEEVRKILVEKARAGLDVHLIYDPVGCYGIKKRYWRTLRDAGVEVTSFSSVKFPRFGTRINWRVHRKICIIDDCIGYIGGMNLADRYATGGESFEMWRDMHLRVTGSIVASLKVSFIIDRSFVKEDNALVDRWNDVGKNISTDGDMKIQLVTSGPTSQWSNIELMFLRSIGAAKNRIFIATPYFLPSSALLSSLQAAALSGVDVRIMMPLRSDSKMLTKASSSYITECLQSGIKVYLFSAGMLHSKMLLVDNEITSIGSTNFDFRSFEHNFEANLFIYSEEMNRQVAEMFFSDQKLSVRVDAEQWSKRSITEKGVESLARLFAPIL
ncbi:MAG: cardiolipin synthase [Muribaculaceae bacterium]|nr:cardiolipin synthase [Muribaculaceae bacterium]